MPKSFLIKKILGLDEDQSVPSLKVEDNSDDLSLEDSQDNRKGTIDLNTSSSRHHGFNLLHYPEYMHRQLMVQSFLLSQKNYYQSLEKDSSRSRCHCRECLGPYGSMALPLGLLPVYHNPFYSGQADSTTSRTNATCSPQKRVYSPYNTSKTVEDLSPRVKLRIIEGEKMTPNSPAAVVPESRGESTPSPCTPKTPTKEGSVDSGIEGESKFSGEESMDSFDTNSEENESNYSGSRRGSSQFSEDQGGSEDAFGGKGKEFPCSNCHMTFARSSDLQRHSLIHSKEKPYVCYICERGFTWFGNFQKHVLSHDGDYKVYHPLLFMKNTAEEELIIRDGSNFKCKLCQKQFTRMSGLRTHVRMHTGQRPFKCPTCSFAFTTSRALKMHMRIHTGERPYKCDECPKAFTRRDELQAHIYMHKGEKPFKCDQCNSAFIRYGHLQRHLLTHSADKPYKCKWCPKSFTQYRNLQTHTYKHTGERPFKCTFCGKGFTQYGTLQAHERTHTGKKPFQCKNCDKAFITSSHLRWHIKRHHHDKIESCDQEENNSELIED